MAVQQTIQHSRGKQMHSLGLLGEGYFSVMDRTSRVLYEIKGSPSVSKKTPKFLIDLLFRAPK